MPGADRNDEGKYTDTYPEKDFIEAIREHGGQAGTRDIADDVGCAYETAYKKLRSLEDKEKVSSQKVANARLWIVEE